MEVEEMGRGIDVHALAKGLGHGAQERDQRALAVGAGHMNHGRQMLLGMAKCGEQVLDELAGHQCMFVWGNCDQPAPSVREYVEHLGLTWPASPLHVTVSGKRIGVYHGHERHFDTATTEHSLDYLFYGHTHEYADHMENGCRLINPGALYRARVHTVALLDLETDRLTFLQVENGKEVAATVRV